jgi:DNA-binding PadR family transcriptional regulator
MREHLRRDLHHGSGDLPFSLRDLFGRGRPGATVRRGEIRPLILAVLLDKPMHGYEVIQELEAKSGGRWRPSAGSVYPTLQQLVDEGLATSEEVDGRRTYTLTDDGKTAAAAASTRTSWTESDTDTAAEPDIRQLAMQLAGAVMQVHKMGSPNARREARTILADARRQMYRLLADDEESTVYDGSEPA